MALYNPQPYYSVRLTISDGDLLLFRGRGLIGKSLIGSAGRSEYSHAAMAGWWDQRLFALETRQWYGGRAVALSNYVLSSPGMIDVFASQLSRGKRRAALDLMKTVTGKPYGWRTILWHSLRAAPFVRWIVSPPNDDRANGRFPVCSSAVAHAYRSERGANEDPVPFLSDRATMPGDLARSRLFEYRFTLTPPVEYQRQECHPCQSAGGESPCRGTQGLHFD